MEKHSPVNPNHIILCTITVLILVIVISGTYRSRRTSTTGADRMLPVQQEHSRMETPPAQAYSNKSRTVKDDEWYRQRILKLVEQIRDNPALTDHAGTKKTDYDRTATDMTNDHIRSSIVSSFKPFTDRVNLSPDKKENFYNILTDKKIDKMDIAAYSYSGISSLNMASELAYINEEYDKLLSDLLTEDEFDEYENYEIQLKQRRKELISNIITVANSTNISMTEKNDMLEGLLRASTGILTDSEKEGIEEIISDHVAVPGMVSETAEKEEYI